LAAIFIIFIERFEPLSRLGSFLFLSKLAAKEELLPLYWGYPEIDDLAPGLKAGGSFTGITS
jgi:hypothetical protein